MMGVDRPLLILFISVAKTWRYHSWIETEPSFSNSDFLSLLKSVLQGYAYIGKINSLTTIGKT